MVKGSFYNKGREGSLATLEDFRLHSWEMQTWERHKCKQFHDMMFWHSRWHLFYHMVVTTILFLFSDGKMQIIESYLLNYTYFCFGWQAARH